MKKLIFLLLCLVPFLVKSQTEPSGFPSPYSRGWLRYGYVQEDSAGIYANSDTTRRPSFPGLRIQWLHNGKDTSVWVYNGAAYIKQLNTQDTLPSRFLVTPTGMITFVNGQGFIKNITGFVQQGSNVTITGSGTLVSPYIINSTATGGADSAVNPGLFMTQTIVGTTKTLINDTSVSGFSGYYLRRKDSTGLTGFATNYQDGLKLLKALPSGQIFVGNSSGIATAVTMSGDGTINNIGNFQLNNIITPGSCTNCNIIFNAKGQPTAYSNGSGGGGGNTNSNIGSGFRWAVPNTNNIKTVFGNLIIWDSTTNTNALTATADTTSGNQKLATQGFVSRGYQPVGNYLVQIFGKSPINILGTDTVVADTTVGNQKLATQGFVSRGFQPLLSGTGYILQAGSISSFVSGSATNLIGYNASGVGSAIILGTNLSITGNTLNATGSSTRIFNVGGGFNQVIGGDSVRSLRCTGCSIDSSIYGVTNLTVLQPFFYILDYSQGHTGDSITDFAPYIDSAIAHMPKATYQTGGTLYFPAGTFYLSRPVKIPSFVNIFGVGTAFPITGSGQTYGDSVVGTSGGTVIQTRGSYNAFEFDTTANPTPTSHFKRTFSNVIKDMMFTCDTAGNPTAGSAIYVQNGLFTLFDNIVVNRFYTDITIKAGFQYTFRHCGFYNPVNAAMDIGNNIEPDAGDFLLDDIVFSTNGHIGATYPKGIIYRGGGGFKGTNLKFNGAFPAVGPGTRFSYPIYAYMTQGNTSDFMLTNSSIENYDTTAVYINVQGGYNFQNVMISGIQTAGGSSVGTAINVNNVQNVVIGPCTFSNAGTSINQPVMSFNNVSDLTVNGGTQNGNYLSRPQIAMSGVALKYIDPSWSQQLLLGSYNDASSNTSNAAIAGGFTDSTGLGYSSFILKNEWAGQASSLPAYNLSYGYFWAGNGSVHTIAGSTYSTSSGSGGAAPFNFSGALFGTTTNQETHIIANSALGLNVKPNGNVLFGGLTTDNNAFAQIPANTTSNASLFLTGASSDVTSPVNGMLWYNSSAHSLNFRDNGVTTNLLVGGAGTNIATVLNSGAMSATATWIMGGNLWKNSGLSHDTTSTTGLLGEANDSSVRLFTWSNVANKLLQYLPSDTLTALNALTQSGSQTNDTLSWGGPLVKSTSIDGSSSNYNVTFGSPNVIGTFSIDANNISLVGATLFAGSIRVGNNNATNANYTMNSADNIILLPTVTANRSITMASGSNGQLVTFVCRNTSGTFNWSFGGGVVQDATGNTITTLTNGSSYQLVYDGTSSKWVKIN